MITEKEKGTWMSVLTLSLMVGTVYAFIVQPTGTEYRLDQPMDFFSSRVLLCLFCAHSLWGMTVQLFYLLVIMAVAESSRGSVFYFPEAVAKVLLINGLATGLYWGLASLRWQPQIDTFLELQAAAPMHGFGFLCTLEALQAALTLVRGAIGRSRSRLKLLGLLILLGVLAYFYYFRLAFLAALLLGFWLSFSWLSLSAGLQRSQLLRAIDWRLDWARRGLFLRRKTEQSVAMATSAALELKGDAGADEADATKADEDDTKSRHEEINITDYVRPPSAQPRDADSFEI